VSVRTWLAGTPAGGKLSAPTPDDLEMLRQHLLGECLVRVRHWNGLVWLTHEPPGPAQSDGNHA
jgi:hypothetical protein